MYLIQILSGLPLDMETIEIYALTIIISFKLILMFIAIYQIKKQENNENNNNNPDNNNHSAGTA